ncbi:MAG: caspase family protein [Desulfobacterales bacterium]|nr:MAG: caspase family protein [Desulfobacterales bacterium]
MVFDRKIASLFVILLASLICAALGLAKTYQWEDYTQPFTTDTGYIGPTTAVQIQVHLPDHIIERNEFIYLKIASSNLELEPHPMLKINDSFWGRYTFSKNSDLSDKPLKIKTKYLKPGLNIFEFYAQNAYGSRYLIRELQFDLPQLEGIEPPIAVKPAIPRVKEPSIPKPAEPAIAKGEEPAIPKIAEKDTKPPAIIITSHDAARGITVKKENEKMKIAGKAVDKSGILTVLVNNRDVAFDRNGNFETVVDLLFGKNEFTVAARDRYGNIGRTTLTVVREEPRPESPDEIEPSLSGKNYALVIGNDRYSYIDRLVNARNDARAVGKMLRDQFGFESRILLDATREDIVRAINDYNRILKEQDSLLIYYAGHGEFDEIANKAYWLPVDASADEDTNWIIADTVTSNIRRMASMHVLVVADSCFSGTLTRRRGITGLMPKGERYRYLRKMLTKKSRTLLASGGNEPVSDYGAGGHSVFAAAFLQGLESMKQDMFSAEELFYDYIKEKVAGSSSQIPEYKFILDSGHEGGDFIFRRIGK